MSNCSSCRFAKWDYITVLNSVDKRWFICGCMKELYDPENDNCEGYEDWSNREYDVKTIEMRLPTVQSKALSCSEIPNSSDCISRQAAIDAIMGEPPEAHYPSWYAGKIKELPSAQPEREKGKWINHMTDGYIDCPFCGALTTCSDGIEDIHFCFSCGAELEGE